MALAAGATFVAQAYAIDMKNMVDVITKAVDHKGFSYVNIFTPCVTFNQFNTVEWYNGHLKKLADIRKTMILMIRLLRSICFPTPTASYWALFMKEGAVPFGEIVPSADVRLADHVEKPSAELFEDLCMEFR